MADLHEPEATLEAAWQADRLPAHRDLLHQALNEIAESRLLERDSLFARAQVCATRATALAAIADQVAIRDHDLEVHVDITDTERATA